jgi:ankyrin repeat protein
MGFQTFRIINNKSSRVYNSSNISSQQKNNRTETTQPYIIRSRYNNRNEFQLINTDIASRKINAINFTRVELQTSYELITKLIATTDNIIKESRNQAFNVADLSWVTDQLITTTVEYDKQKYFFVNDFINDVIEYCDIIKRDYNSKDKLIKFLTTANNNLSSLLQEHKKHNIAKKSRPFILKLINDIIHFFRTYIKKNMLFKAIANKDNSKVESLLKCIDVNTVKNGETLLMCALSHNNIEVVDQLVKAGIDINTCYVDGNSILMEAIYRYRYEFANKLITCGADLDIVDYQGRSALMLATACRRPDIVKNLIAHDADVNLVNIEKNSALITALTFGQTDIAKLLIESNANVELENKDEVTALSIAKAKGYKEISKMLVEAQNITQLKRGDTEDLFLSSVKNKISEAMLYHDNTKVENLLKDIDAAQYGQSLLRHALFSNNIEVVDILVKNGVDINAVCYFNDYTVLMEAVIEGNEAFVNKLINCNADIERVNVKGNSALMLAVLHDRLDIANSLIAHNANIDLVNSNSKSVLMLAITYNFPDIAKSLIEHGADINLVDSQKNSALMLALSYNQLDTAKLLIEHNANIKLENTYKETPLIIATKKDFDEIIKILVDTGKTTRLDRANALLAQKTTTDNIILSQINPLPQNDTALMIAIKTHANLEYVKFCIEQGTDTIDAQDQDGNTALMIALQSNRKDVAELLIEQGADIKIINKKNNKALNIALEKGYYDILNYL